LFFYQELLHSSNKLAYQPRNADNVNANIHVEPWLFQKINVTLIILITVLCEWN